jgi:hypothetical protein
MSLWTHTDDPLARRVALLHQPFTRVAGQPQRPSPHGEVTSLLAAWCHPRTRLTVLQCVYYRIYPRWDAYICVPAWLFCGYPNYPS